MKPINQVKSYSVCLHGVTLPINCLYGNVYGTTFTCINFTPIVKSGKKVYAIRIWRDGNNPGWVKTNTLKYGAIYNYIRTFMASPEFVNEPVIPCEHWHKRAERAQRDHERSVRKANLREAEERRQWWRDNMMDAPREKRAQQTMIYRGRPIKGEHSAYYEETERVGAMACYVGMDRTEGASSMHGDDFFRSFEQGQTTCGEIGEYTRSGYETRDHLKTSFKNYRPEDTRPIITPNRAKDGDVKMSGAEHHANPEKISGYTMTARERSYYNSYT